MGKIFVDTSALFALVNAVDGDNLSSQSIWKELLQDRHELWTNNYIIVECISLLQRRLGLEFVRLLESEILPVLEVEWLDKEHHALAVAEVLQSNRRNLSLVDCSAFETMRRLEIETAFTFDDHFRAEGFKTIP
jgi:predicted nucleic acid-binding protein